MNHFLILIINFSLFTFITSFVYQGLVTDNNIGENCKSSPYNAPVDEYGDLWTFCYKTNNQTGIVFCYRLITDYEIDSTHQCSIDEICDDVACPDPEDYTCCIKINDSEWKTWQLTLAVILGLLADCFIMAIVAFMIVLAIFFGIANDKRKEKKKEKEMMMMDDEEEEMSSMAKKKKEKYLHYKPKSGKEKSGTKGHYKFKSNFFKKKSGN